MTLKITLNNSNNRLITPLRTFINGSRERLIKGFTFINGEKVQLWGNTRLETFSMPYSLGFSTNNLYIDSNNLYVFGEDAIVPVSVSGGGTTGLYMNDVLAYYTITNPTVATFDGYSQWGKGVMFSPDESSASEYIYYATTDSIRNKIKIEKDVGASVVSTYNVPVNAPFSQRYTPYWCILLDNGNNLWVGSFTRNYITTYYLFNNNTSITTVSGNAALNPSFDNGDIVVSHYEKYLYVNDISGSTIITTDTCITSKILDGSYVFFAGYKNDANSYAKVKRYDIDNDSTVWEVVFADDRKLAVIGEGNSKYYVVDEPVDYNASDQNVYLRIYDGATGTELESAVINYENDSSQRIIDWKTFPIKAKNGILSMQYVSSQKLYICKVFID